jgi:virginiamycin B lyase
MKVEAAWGVVVLVAGAAGCGERSLTPGDSSPGTPACGAGATVVQMPLRGPAPVVEGTPAFQPEHIITGPDGNLWLTEVWARVIGRLTPDGRHDQFPVAGDPPDLTRQLEGIAAGPDGNIWFTEPGTSQSVVARITPAGQITEFPLPPSTSDLPRWPMGLTAGPDGNIWFADPNASSIGVLGVDGVLRSENVLPKTDVWLDVPSTLVLGPDKNMWFGEATRLGRLTPAGVVTFFPVPQFNGMPWGSAPLLALPGGTLWGNGPESSLRRIALPGADASQLRIDDLVMPNHGDGSGQGAGGLAYGSDGNVWYTAGENVGCVTPDGRFHQIPLPLPGLANDITLGPDGALWFTETMFDRVGRISLNGSSL